MIEEFDDSVESVFELDNIGFPDCMLVKSNTVLYIETPDAVFPFESTANFVIDKDSIYLINEDKDIIKFTMEQFQIINDLLEKF
jgi:hypothetical protein